MLLSTTIGILIPFIGTSLGAAMVFVLKDKMSEKLQKGLTGFAAGVMVAASFWSLLVPALEQSSSLGKFSFVPAAVGFLVGVGFLLFLDEVTPHIHLDNTEEGPKENRLSRSMKLILAVTLHNIPEGMAVGVVYAGWLNGNSSISTWYCDSKLPRGCHCVNASKSRGDAKVEDLCIWCIIRFG